MEEKKKPGVKNPAHKLAKQLQENRKSLFISRVPDKAKEEFIALAKAEFCGDYGMALKWLIDDILSQESRMIITRLEDHESRIRALEIIKQSGNDEPVKTEEVTMLDGSTRKVVKRNG